MATSLSNKVKPFFREGDVVAWLRKVNLVVKLLNVDNVAAVIPLFQESDTLALYLELSEQDQEDVDIIRMRLKQAFAESPYEIEECAVDWKVISVCLQDQAAGGVGRIERI